MITIVLQSLQLKINNKKRMSQKISFLSNPNFCKNHIQTPSKYFITDQPWLKYCKDCAFNIALCGKKIQKQLTSQQFDRKMYISSIAAELKQNIDDIQENNNFCNNLTRLLEEASRPMQERIQDIQNGIKQLVEAKQKLREIYHREIADRVLYIFEKQSRIAMFSMQMRRQLQNIESNFGNYIDMENGLQFQKNKEIWNNILVQNRKELLHEKGYIQTHDTLLQIIQDFYHKFENLTQFKIKTTFDKRAQRIEKISSFEQQFNMTLTPLQATSLNTSVIADNMKLNSMKNKGQLKLRSNRKMNTDRQTKTSSKTINKRSMILGSSSQNVSIMEILMSGKKNYR